MTKRAQPAKRKTSGSPATAASLRTTPVAEAAAPVRHEETHGHPPRGASWAGLSLERQLMLWGIALLLLATILYFLSPVLAPFVAGTALGYLLDPVADRLQRLGMSRLSAALILLVFFITFVVTALIILLPILSRQFAGLVTSMPGYLQTLGGLVVEWQTRFTGDYFNDWLQTMGLGPEWLQKIGIGPASSFDTQKYIDDLTNQGATLIGDFVKSLVWRGYALINVITLVVITPVVAFYMMLDWDQMIHILDNLVPPRHRDDVRYLAGEINEALAGFVRGQSVF
jgi:predicted PurR-regulated permease PerM